MILTATDPGAHNAFTLGYALTAVGVAAAIVAGAILVRYLDVTIGRHLRRHVSRALDNGDRNIADATDAMAAARRRPSVPRQLEERAVRRG